MIARGFPSTGTVEVLVSVGLASLVLDFAISYAVALAHPGYSHVSQYMSELAVPGQAFATLLSGWWVVYGVCLVLFSVGLGTCLPAVGVLRWLAPASVAVAGLGLGVGGGFFPCDSACAGVTPSGQAHTASALLGSVALVMSPFLFCFSLHGTPGARQIRKITITSAVVGVGVFAVFLSTGSPGSPRADVRGLWQRLFLAVYYLWLAALALYCLRVNQERRSDPQLRGQRPAA